MKSFFIGLGTALVLLVLISIGTYNGLVSKQESVRRTRAEVETQYQRRFELIPNLVETVKGFAAHEKAVFTEITEARAKVGQTQPVSLEANPAATQQYAAAQAQLGQSLGKLIAVAENYPTLKSNETFVSLMSQLEGTQNRIAAAIRNNQQANQEYNKSRRSFPNNLVGRLMGFPVSEEDYFRSAVGADTAPMVKF